MRIWTIILYTIIIIYQNHVYHTAPVGKSGSAKKGELKTKFGKIADQIINPKWTLIDPDSKKKKNDSDPSNNTVNEKDENQTQPNTPNTQNNDGNRIPKINNKRKRKKSNNKRNSNKRKQNNKRRNGRHRWYKMVTVDYLLGDLPEYRNHEDEQNIVLIWGDGDERKIELNEHVDALSMKNLNNNQLIRKKRDYNNTFQLQNKLQTKNFKQEDLTENEKDKLNIEANAKDRSQDVERQNKKKNINKIIEKSRDPNSIDKELSLIDNLEDDENIYSNSIENSNESMKFLNLKNSNKNKFQHFVRRPNHAQKLGKTSGKNYSETESLPLKTVKQKPNNLNNIPTISKYEPEFTPKGNADTATDIPEFNEIDSMMGELDSQNNELYSSSLETKMEIPNYSDIEDNKESDILNNKRHPVKSKSKKKRKKQPDKNKKLQNRIKQKIGKPLASNNINEKGSHQKTIKPNLPSTNDILIISYDEPEMKTKVNSDIAENNPEPDEIDNIMDAMNSNSDENLDDQNNSSYPSSLETKQEIPNYSDIEDIKEHDILNNIKHPLKPKSKSSGKKQSDDNDKLPKTIKRKLTPPLELNNNHEKGSPQKSLKPLALNLNEIPRKSNDVPNLTTGGNNDKVTNTPGPDEIDNIMDAMNSNSDEKLDDQNNSSYPSSLETKQEIPNYSDIEDFKEHDILNNIKHPLKPKSKKSGKKQSDDNDKLPKTIKQKLTQPLELNKNNEKESPRKSLRPLAPNLNEIPRKSNDVPNLTTGGNNDKVTNTPGPDEIDNIMDAMNSNSDEKLDDQNNSSYPSSLETKQEIPNYSDIEDFKEQDILNNIKHPLKPKSKKSGKKQSDDNDELPKTIKQKLTPPLELNNNHEKGSPQKSLKPLALNLNEIPRKSNDVPNLTTGGNNDKVTNTPGPDEIDNIMDAMNSNSDEKLDDQNNSSNPSSLETKQEIPNYSDIEDFKEHDILNNIKHPLKPKSKSSGKKQSDDNDKQLKTIKQKLTPPLELNNNHEKGSPQKSLKPLALNLNEIPRKSNDVPNLTTGGNNDKVTNTPGPDEIDNIMDAMNSNSDEKLDDQNNSSYPSSLETKQEIPNYSDIEDIKEHDILNNIKHPLKPKSKSSGKKQSDDNDKQLKTKKQKLTPSLELNNNNEKGSPQKSLKPLALNLNEIPRKSNDVPNLTTGGNNDKVTNTPGPDEIDNIMDAMNSNSDEKLDDQNNSSNPSSLETKQEIPNYSDIEDFKEQDILNNIKHPLKPKSKKSGKKQSDDNDELPKTIKQKLTPPLELNNNHEKGSPQKSLKPLALNLNEIPRKSNDVPNLTTGGNNDKVTNTPGPDEIDNIMDAMNSNSDEKLDDQNNSSNPSSLETKQEIPNYSDIEDFKEHDILNNIKHPLKPKSKSSGKKQSDDNDKQLKNIKQKLTPPLELNNNHEKGSPQKSLKPLALNLNEIPRKSNDVPNLTTGGNNDKVTNTTGPDEIDNIMDAMNSNSDEKLDDQNNSSNPSSLETKQEIPNYSDIEDFKEHDILNNIKHPLKPKSKSSGKKQSDDNDKQLKTIKQKLTPPLELNNNHEKGSPQKSLKPLALNLNEIPRKSNDVPNLTTGGNNDKVTNTPGPDEIDNIMDAMNSNSDEKLDDQNNSSNPSSLETKQEIPNYSDIEDFKEHDILNNIKHPLKPKSKKSGKKQSDDNDKLPKTIKQKLTPPLELNNNHEKGSPQKSLKPLALNLNEIPRKSNDVPNLTTEGNYDKVTNIPEPDEIDNIMDAMNSNSDEKLDDQNNSSNPSSLETKQEIPNYSDIKDHDIFKKLEYRLQPTSKTLSNNNEKFPNKHKINIGTQLKPNNIVAKDSFQNYNITPNVKLYNETDACSNGDLLASTGREKLPKTDIDDIAIIPEKIYDNSSRNSNVNKFKSEPPNDDYKLIVEKNKPGTKSHLISNAKLKTPHLIEEIIQTTNKTPTNCNTLPLMDIHANDIDTIDISKDYNNLGSMTMEDSDVEKTKDKSPNRKNEQNHVLKKKKKINPKINNNKFQPEIAEYAKSSNYKDKTPGDQLEIINNVSNKNPREEKLNDKTSSRMPMPDSNVRQPTNTAFNNNIFHNVTQPNPFESKTGKPISFEDTIKGKSVNIPTPGITKPEERISNNIPSNYKTIKPELATSIGALSFSDEEPDDLLALIIDHSYEKVNEEKPSDKSISSSFEELLKSPIDKDCLLLPSINVDDINVTPIEKHDKNLPSSKDDKTEFSIPCDHNSQKILEKKKSLENLSPNSKTIIKTPHITEEPTLNKHDKPNIHSKTPSIDNPDKDVEFLDISDDYNNLGDMTMEDSDLKKTEDKSPNKKTKHDNSITEKNKPIREMNYKKVKPEVSDSIGALNFSGENPDDKLALFNDNSYEKVNEEKPSDKSIVLVPTTDKIPKPEKRLSTDETFDKNSDSILNKVPQTNPFESKPGIPISDDDALNGKSNFIPIPSISKNDEGTSNNSPGIQKIIDLVDNSVSSSIEEILKSPIDKDGLLLPSINVDDINVTPIEKHDKNLPSSKDDKTEFSIPCDHNSQKILEKKKSLENLSPNSKTIIKTPHITEEPTLNKHDKPNIHSKTPSIDNPDKDVEFLDISDDYNNLGDMTMEDSDLKKTEDKSPNKKTKHDNSITEKNKSIPDMNYKKVKPEVAESIGSLNFSDEKPDDKLAFIDDHLYKKANDIKPIDKPIVLEPTKDKIPKPEKRLSTDETFDKNSYKDSDSILHKVSQTKPFESKPGKPISDDDALNGKNNFIPIPSISKNDEGTSNNSPGIQKIIDLVDNSVSSSIEEILKSPIDKDGLLLPSINVDDINVTPIEKHDKNLPSSKDDKTEFSIPCDHNSQKILEKKKSLENLSPNSKTIIKTPHITEGPTLNKHDKPNIHSKTPSIDNPDKDVEFLDISDDYNNLGGMTMEDSDLKKTEDKSPNKKTKHDNSITEKNKSIPDMNYKKVKPEVSDSIGALNFSGENPDDKLALFNDNSYEKVNEEKPSDKSIVLVPTTDKIPKPEKRLSTDETFDKNSDSILNKVPQTNPFESKPGKPISDDDALNGKSNFIPIPSISKNDEGTSNNSPGIQKIIDLVDNSVSSSIEEILKSPIDKDGLLLPSINVDDINVTPIEKHDKNLPSSKDDKTEFSIPCDHNSQKILEKKKSLENLSPNSKTIIKTPHITEEPTLNKHDKPNIYSKTPSIDNPDKDVEFLDISDDYNNLGDMTMEDSDLKKTEDKSPNKKTKHDNSITEKNKSIPDMNYKKVKPEVAESIGSLNFSDEKPDDKLAFIDDHLYKKANDIKPIDKPIVLEPTKDKIPKPEKRLSTDETFDKNSYKDSDSILHKVSQTKPFESKPGKPISDDDALNGKSNFIPIPSISKNDEGISNNSPGIQKIIDLVDNSVSSSIEEILKKPIDKDGLLLPSINVDDINVTPIEKHDKNLPSSKDDKTEFSIPCDHNSQKILEKKKSLENLSPNSKTIIKTPHITEGPTLNKHDKPNIHSKTPSIDNPDKDVEFLDISDDYNNLGGMTMEDSDLKKTEDKSPNKKTKHDNSITEKNKSIPDMNYKKVKPEVSDSIGALNFSGENPDDKLALFNDNSYEKVNEEKPSDKSIVLVPTTDKIPKPEKRLSTDETFDKNSDSILNKVPQTNPFESKPGKPISDDDALNGKSNFIPIPSISKNDEGTSNNSPGIQKIIDLVDNSVSSSIEEILKSPIDKDGLLLPSINVDDINVTPIEKHDKNLPSSKDDKTEFSIPCDHNSQKILEKKKSLENLTPNSKTIIKTPHITEEPTLNKHDKPNIHSKTPSIDNPDKDVEFLDISDDYNNLGDMTMEDSDLKKTEDKSPNKKTKHDNSITEKNKSIPDMNYKKVKPEVAESIGSLNFSDEKPDDKLAFIDDHLYKKANDIKPIDKPIVLEPTKDKIPKPEKRLSTDETFDKNSYKDSDSILHKVSQTKPFESKPGKPISDDDALNGKSNFIPIPSISKNDEGISNNSPGIQKIIDLVDNSVSSSIEELLKTPIDKDGLLLPSINVDDINVTPIEKHDKNLPSSKYDKTKLSIPCDHNSQKILEKKKSLENLSPNSKTIIKTPHITEEPTSNKHDKPNIHSKTPSIDNPDKDVEFLDISDDYNNLGDMTMEDSDLKKTEDKSPNKKTKHDNSITEKNKSIPDINYKKVKPEVAESIGSLNFSDEKPDDKLAFIDDHLYEKANDIKPIDKPIVLEPTKDKIPKHEKRLSTDETFDKNSNKDSDSILHKVPQTKPLESKTGKPISNDDALNGKSNFFPIPSISKNDEGTSNNSPGIQKIIDLVDNSVSSSIEELLKTPIDKDGLLLPSINVDDINVTPIEKHDKNFPSSKYDKTEFSIPCDHNSQKILEKKKSLENLSPNSKTIIKTPHITEEPTLNKHDKPNIHSKTPSIDNPDKDVEFLDISDDYNNLGGMTMEDSDLKKTEDKSPNKKTKHDNSITEKNKSIPDMNYKKVKPEVAESIGSLNFSDEKPDDKLAVIDDHLYKKANDIKPVDKSIVLEPTKDKIPKPEKRLSTDETFDKNSDSILNKVPQTKPFESKTGKPLSDDDALNSKSNFIPIPSVLKDDEISDINKTEVKLPNRILTQKKTAKNILSSTNVHEKIFPGNLSNSGQYGFKPISLNSKISNLDEHILITNKDEHSSVLSAIDKHNNSLLDDDEEMNLSCETEPIVDNSKYLSENHKKNIPVNQIKQQNNEFRRTPANMKHTKNETLKEIVKTEVNNDNPKVNTHDGFDNNYYDSNHIDKLPKIINENSNIYNHPSTIVTSEVISPIMSDYNLLNEDDNPYGYMLPKFRTKYIEGGNSNNLWEIVPPKKNNDFSIHKESDNYNNEINQSVDYTKNNIISSRVNNDKKTISETETVKHSYDDKENTDIHNKMYDDFIKKMSEQLFKKIDNIDDKISKLDKLSNNSSYITQSYSLRSDDPGTKNIILMKDLPINKPKNKIEEPDSELDSKINKSVESHETMISYKSNEDNVIEESTKPSKDKHKKHKRHNKKHKKHSKHDRHKKKKSHKKNDKNDSYNDDEDDDDDDVDDRHKKYKIHRKNDKKDDDDKHKKNKSHKKNEMIDSNVDDDDDDDDDNRVNKKSLKKNYINDDDIKVLRNKKTDNKKKKKIKDNILLHESNEVNKSCSLQMNSEDDDSVKGLKIKSKSKNSKKTNSTKRKKSSPKKKSKHMKHSKYIKYKNKEIPVDVSDEDSSSNKKNYNFEEFNVKTSRINNENNVPKEKTHKHKMRKHKKHKKPLKTSKTYKYKEIPVDNEDLISDENNVNLEETYNINITNDDNALKQKRLRHKRLKKMKNIDINIVKDTDNQVLNKDTDTRHGYQFYTFYPQYRYTNPFARLFY
ncbi:uncharacterized protein LOC132939006 isoform X2 [Metopolophium dirhodum]|uniref:uncharacterized protein LOC132939006 isoform X2 n=1 Tax=Metopolophium dirhodum TaxID=44670 RepID=UPI00298FBA31|nr:uncharacterized protein LOC132939006 isoform X2 [Metopolophium dirhodum]